METSPDDSALKRTDVFLVAVCLLPLKRVALIDATTIAVVVRRIRVQDESVLADAGGSGPRGAAYNKR